MGERGKRYDYSQWLADFQAQPEAELTLTVPVSWSVINSFSDDLDGRIVANARRGGATLWSEDNDTEQRVYHLTGSGRSLKPVIDQLQRDLNQPHETSFTMSGSNNMVASFQAALNSMCSQFGVPRPHYTPYSGRWRSSLVIDVSGKLGAVSDMLRAVQVHLLPQIDQAPPRVRRPARAPIPHQAPPELGLSA